jgi:predicted restriction endonuclease
VALIDARLGQGKFRDDLFELWGGCAVSGCKVSELLRASHVKPWRRCTNKERLDPDNGLLLGAHLDALFDAGLISFDDNGSMLVSVEISDGDREELRLGRRLRKSPSDELKGNLAYHRQNVVQDIMTYEQRGNRS